MNSLAPFWPMFPFYTLSKHQLVFWCFRWYEMGILVKDVFIALFKLMILICQKGLSLTRFCAELFRSQRT